MTLEIRHPVSALSREKGVVIVLVAMFLVILLAFAALAIEIGYLYDYRRRMQAAADAGALGGGCEIYRDRTSEVVSSARAATANNGFTNGSGSIAVTVNYPPASGPYTNNSSYDEVLIRENVRTFFAPVIGLNSVQVTARAVAGVGANSTHCEEARKAFPDNRVVRIYLGEPITRPKHHQADPRAPAWANPCPEFPENC